MSKIDDFAFRGVPQEVTNFKDAVTNLLNFGKVQFQVVSTVPTFAGRPGEVTIYRSGTDGRVYLYLGSSWNLAVLFTADAA